MKKLELSRSVFNDLCESRNLISNGLSLLDGALENARMYADKGELPSATVEPYIEFGKKFNNSESEIRQGLRELENLIDKLNRIHNQTD